jgi:hypothetical protein
VPFFGMKQELIRKEEPKTLNPKSSKAATNGNDEGKKLNEKELASLQVRMLGILEDLAGTSK